MTLDLKLTTGRGGNFSLRGCQCRVCEVIRYPADADICPRCWSDYNDEVGIGRVGYLHSYTVVHRSNRPEAVPFVVGWVDLPEGPRIMSLLQSGAVSTIQIGMKLEIQEAPEEPLGFVYRVVEAGACGTREDA